MKNDSTDLIPDQVKVSILLESKFDLISAERDLREIEVLKHRGVDGSGDLESESQQYLLVQRSRLTDKDYSNWGRSWMSGLTSLIRGGEK